MKISQLTITVFLLSNFLAVLPGIVLADEPGKQKKTQQTDASSKSSDKLPFITRSSAGWVLATVPEEVKQLAVCKVLGRKYACLPEEKIQYGAELADVERVLLSGFN